MASKGPGDTPTCQLLPITAKKRWSVMEKAGKTMEILEDRLCAWVDCASCMNVRENAVRKCCAWKRFVLERGEWKCCMWKSSWWKSGARKSGLWVSCLGKSCAWKNCMRKSRVWQSCARKNYAAESNAWRSGMGKRRVWKSGVGGSCAWKRCVCVPCYLHAGNLLPFNSKIEFSRT